MASDTPEQAVRWIRPSRSESLDTPIAAALHRHARPCSTSRRRRVAWRGDGHRARSARRLDRGAHTGPCLRGVGGMARLAADDIAEARLRLKPFGCPSACRRARGNAASPRCSPRARRRSRSTRSRRRCVLSTLMASMRWRARPPRTCVTGCLASVSADPAGVRRPRRPRPLAVAEQLPVLRSSGRGLCSLPAWDTSATSRRPTCSNATIHEFLGTPHTLGRSGRSGPPRGGSRLHQCGRRCRGPRRRAGAIASSGALVAGGRPRPGRVRDRGR